MIVEKYENSTRRISRYRKADVEDGSKKIFAIGN